MPAPAGAPPGAGRAPQRLRWREWVLVAAVAAVAGLGFQGSRGLWRSTEGRYAECAREMLETGDWLVPHLDGRPHWTKPPLAYWAIAGGMAILGRNEWGARLSDGVAFIGLALAMAALGAACWDRATGLTAGLIYATSPFAVGAANTISTDTWLALWSLLAVLAYWKAWRGKGGRAERVGSILFWLAVGLGFLTKGPPVLLVVSPVVVLHVWMRLRGRDTPRLFTVAGLAVFAAVGLGWYAWAVLTHPGLLSYLLGVEIVTRVTTGAFHRNPEWYKPLVIYLPLLTLGAGTWMLFLPRILRHHRAMLGGRALKALLGRNERVLFLALWVGLPLIVFSLIKSRMPLYVLPLLPPVVLGLARGLVRVFGEGLRKPLALATAAALVLAVAGKAVIATVPSTKDERHLYEVCRPFHSPDTRIVLYGLNEHYGLQFYLEGHVQRAAAFVDEEGAARELRAVLDDLRAHPAWRTYVFVTDTGCVAALRWALGEEGMAFEDRASALKYRLVVVSADEQASRAAPARE